MLNFKVVPRTTIKIKDPIVRGVVQVSLYIDGTAIYRDQRYSFIRDLLYYYATDSRDLDTTDYRHRMSFFQMAKSMQFIKQQGLEIEFNVQSH